MRVNNGTNCVEQHNLTKTDFEDTDIKILPFFTSPPSQNASSMLTQCHFFVDNQ